MIGKESERKRWRGRGRCSFTIHSVRAVIAQEKNSARRGRDRERERRARERVRRRERKRDREREKEEREKGD